jgi:N4-gp56 family major capsid protein
MAMTTTANPADVANRLQTHFSPKLLDHTVDTLVMDQFAVTQDLPKNLGAKTMRFFKPRPANRANVLGSVGGTALVEGVAPSTYTESTMGYVDVTLAQKGQVAKLSDVLRAIDAYEPLKQLIRSMGEDAAQDFDWSITYAIAQGMLNSDGLFERFAGVAGTSDSSADYATLLAAASSATKITRARALACVTQLMAQKVPKINGGYVCVVPPQVMHDIRQDTDWLAAATNSKPEQLYKRGVVTLDGVTYVESTLPWIEGNTYGTYDATGTVFTSMFLGRGAYGCPKLAGSSSPMRPKVIVLDKEDKMDPLGQYVLAGWKAFYAAALLKTNQAADVPFLCLLRSKSTFA